MAAGKKKTSSKRNRKISLKEFRAWLEGVEELQPDGWNPDKEQWDKIRKKIDNIVEEEPTVQYVRESRGPTELAPSPPAARSLTGESDDSRMPPPAPSAPVVATGPPVARGSTLEEAAATAPPRQPGPPIDIPPQLGDGGGGSVGTGAPRIKTPDIDTSSGNYGSSFE